MNVQDERIQARCDALALNAVAQHYPVLAQEAADTDASYVDFLERCLKAEQDERGSRSRAMLARTLHEQLDLETKRPFVARVR